MKNRLIPAKTILHALVATACFQLAAMASPDLPTFNFLAGPEGWKISGSEPSPSDLQWQANGGLVLLIKEAESAAIRQWFSSLFADECRTITVSVKSADFPARLHMRWTTDQEPFFSRDKLVAGSDDLVEDNTSPQTVFFDLVNSPGWRDRITSIEIYFKKLGSFEEPGEVVVEKISFEE